MFNFEAKVQAVQIPYRGVADLHRALIARQIDYIFDSYGSSRPLAEAGHVNILAVTGMQRLAVAPDTPTLKEHGLLGGFNALLWLGLVAPAKTPDPIVAKLSAEVPGL
jgi:tripartite-type tricarboxylate transporter receptor subunit TctC